MEWVETTGSSVDEAKDRALDQLGVDEAEAEFEVLQEPKAGLFGRVRGEARIKARVAPREPRPKVAGRQQRRRTGSKRGDSDAQRGRGRKSESSSSAEGEAPSGGVKAAGAKRTRAPKSTDGEGPAAGEQEAVENEAGNGAPKSRQRSRATKAPASGRGRNAARREAQPEGDTVSAEAIAEDAKKYVGGLLEAFGYDGVDVVPDIDGDEVLVRVDGGDLGLLIGPKGQTLQALQDLTRLSINRSVHDSDARLHLDVSGYRQQRREALARFAVEQANEVLSSNEELVLEPMNPADRKVVHDAINEVDGVSTVSEGREGQRRVVILPD